MSYAIEKTPPVPIEGGHYVHGYYTILKGDLPVAHFPFDHPSYQYQIYANDEAGALRDAELFISLMMEPCT